jgi:ACS family sodium-dependent inorganic phosphate cotransporter/ACS family sodium-dependent inorganic phosphate cotransporter-like MFS transporter 9
VWAILVANSVNHACYFVFLFMMPTYFYGVWGLDVRSSALYSLLPWVAMGGLSYAAGALADGLLPRLGARRVRKAAQAIAFLGPAALLAALLRAASPQAALVCLTAALGLASFGQAGFVSNIQDVGGRHAGRLFGVANTCGCLAGIAATTGAGFVLQHGSWALLFQLQAALYVLGFVVYTACAGTEAVTE